MFALEIDHTYHTEADDTDHRGEHEFRVCPVNTQREVIAWVEKKYYAKLSGNLFIDLKSGGSETIGYVFKISDQPEGEETLWVRVLKLSQAKVIEVPDQD